MKKRYEVEIGMIFHIYATEVVEASSEEEAVAEATREIMNSNFMNYMLFHLADERKDTCTSVEYIEQLPAYSVNRELRIQRGNE